ncbi:FusB/FusC family EF-G-binding protein [Brevibacillus sp. HB1.4B]|uniref:FusB/FusC family EF-G-binding protein n=1 Tax=Brevibacillus sp. HB1.4B TaxID=2738845 RepID=UPI00156B015B|nr:FusB/FusC family EF-G-binding protein [Brevibacillus sp. HB1.4B]NRS19089.1 FusB/FusC family EF-G-binding protein [Brevibacillus sp. HB1.4B]
MEPFIHTHQYHFIKSRVQAIMNAFATSTDVNVIRARKEIAHEEIFQLFPNMTEEQKEVLHPIDSIKEKAEGKQFLHQLSPYVIPFPAPTESSIKKLFPKVKKLKVSNLAEIDFSEISYVSWLDTATDKKYIVAYHEGKLIGIHGQFTNVNKKGVCALCNRFEEIGMFVLEAKGSGDGTYLKKGNYICQDSATCNQNIISLDKLNDFISLMVQ